MKVDGLNQLSKKLNQLNTTLAGRALRNATSSAVLPAVKSIKAATPVGKHAHRTYKGRLVSPGFLKRSIRKKSFFRKGKATVLIGVKPEAFYGVHYLDRGIRVSSRRVASSGFARNGGRKRKNSAIKPYRIKGRKWFKFQFIRSEKKIVQRLKQRLVISINKASR